MSTEKIFSCSFIITKKEHRRLYNERTLKYKIVSAISLLLLAIVIIMAICYVCIRPTNQNVKIFLTTACPFLCAIACFLSSVFVGFLMIFSFIPKGGQKITITYDSENNKIIVAQGKKKKVYLLDSMTIDWGSNVAFIYSGIHYAVLPFQETKEVLMEVSKTHL